MPTARKASIIDELSEQLDRAQLTIVADYRGLKVTDLQGLRATLRPMGAEVRVAKNTLAGIAAKNVGIEGLDRVLEGPTALVLAYDDIVGTAKAIGDFARTSRILTVRGGVLEKRFIGAAEVEAVSTLPSREQLYGRFVGLLVSPMSRLMTVLDGPGRLVTVLRARADKLGAGAETPVAAD